MSDFQPGRMVTFRVPDEWVTKGQTRPAVVLRVNDDDTLDLVVYLHPEDRQSVLAQTELRVAPDRVEDVGAPAAAEPAPVQSETPFAPDAPPEPPPNAGNGDPAVERPTNAMRAPGV